MPHPPVHYCCSAITGSSRSPCSMSVMASYPCLSTPSLPPHLGSPSASITKEMAGLRPLHRAVSSQWPKAHFTDSFFHFNPSLIRILLYFNSISRLQIPTNYCTCHDSSAVMPCTKFARDYSISIKWRTKSNFHQIWISMKTLLVKCAQWTSLCLCHD